MAIEKAAPDDIEAFLAEMPQWSVVAGKLHREYQFADFVEAMGFMTKAAIVAERSDHHPEWFNVYRKVIVDLTTHEAAGITERDFDLAKGDGKTRWLIAHLAYSKITSPQRSGKCMFTAPCGLHTQLSSGCCCSSGFRLSASGVPCGGILT